MGLTKKEYYDIYTVPNSKDWIMVVGAYLLFILIAPACIGLIIGWGLGRLVHHLKNNKSKKQAEICLWIIAGVFSIIFIISLVWLFVLPPTWYYFVPLVNWLIAIIDWGGNANGAHWLIAFGFIFSLIGGISFNITYRFTSKIQIWLHEHDKKRRDHNYQQFEQNRLAQQKTIGMFETCLRKLFSFTAYEASENIKEEAEQKKHVNEGEGAVLDDMNLFPNKAFDGQTIICAATKSGKTNTMLVLLRSFLYRRKRGIIIDCKGENEYLDKMIVLCKAYNVPFRFVALNSLPKYTEYQRKYAIWKFKSAKQIQTLMLEQTDYAAMALKDSSSGTFYHKKNEKRILDIYTEMVCFVIEHWDSVPAVHKNKLCPGNVKTPNITSPFLVDHMNMNDINTLQYAIAAVIKSPDLHDDTVWEQGNSLIKRWRNWCAIDITDARLLAREEAELIKALKNARGIIEDVAGSSDQLNESGICIYDFLTAPEKGILLFSLDSNSFSVEQVGLAKIITNDLKQNAAINRASGEECFIGWDEFNRVANDQMADIINKVRSSGFDNVISIQSLADLDKISVAFRQQLISNTNNILVGRTLDPTNADQWSKMLNLHAVLEETHQAFSQVDDGATPIADMGMQKVTQSFYFTSTDLMKLKQGQVCFRGLDETGESVFTREEKIQVNLWNKDLPQ